MLDITNEIEDSRPGEEDLLFEEVLNLILGKKLLIVICTSLFSIISKIEIAKIVKSDLFAIRTCNRGVEKKNRIGSL